VPVRDRIEDIRRGGGSNHGYIIYLNWNMSRVSIYDAHRRTLCVECDSLRKLLPASIRRSNRA
jgi:hypothetical protein